MNNHYTNYSQSATGVWAEAEARLGGHLAKVYALVSLALFIAGVTAYSLAQYIVTNPAFAQTLFSGFTPYILMFSPLVMIMVMSGMVNRASVGTLRIMFFATAVVFGLSDSMIFLIYPMEGIIQTFFVTAGTFAALSVYGLTTKRDLTGVGKIAFIGLIGLIIASLVSFVSARFFGFNPNALNFAISLIGVIVFAGLIMYRSQEIKTSFAYHLQQGTEERAAIFSALSLFIAFINLFHFLLRFLGGRE